MLAPGQTESLQLTLNATTLAQNTEINPQKASENAPELEEATTEEAHPESLPAVATNGEPAAQEETSETAKLEEATPAQKEEGDKKIPVVNEALARAKAIAAKLAADMSASLSSSSSSSPPPPNGSAAGLSWWEGGVDPNTSSSLKRSFEEEVDEGATTAEALVISPSQRHASSVKSIAPSAIVEVPATTYHQPRHAKRAAYSTDNAGHQYHPSQHSSHHQQRYGLGLEERTTGGGANSFMNHPGVILQEFTVPQSTVGLIIGRNGESLKRIETSSGARVQFVPVDASFNDPMRRVTVQGQPYQIERARVLIQQIVDEAVTGKLQQAVRSDAPPLPGQQQTLIRVPNHKVGLVIGRGGETVKALQDRSGARINVAPDHSMKPGDTDREVTITGDEVNITRARNLIEELLATSTMGGSYYGIPGAGGALQAATPGRPGIVTETVEIPNDAAGTIIGRGGETIKWLQQASGARIQVEPSSQATGGIRKVHVSGLHNVVTYARSLIMEQLAAKNQRGELVGPNTVAAAVTTYMSAPVMNATTNAYANYNYTTAYPNAQQYDYSSYYAQYGQSQQQQPSAFDYSAYYAQCYQQQQQNQQR